MIAAAIILTLFCGWRIGRRTQFFAHILQLEGYKAGNYTSWILKRWNDVLLRTSHKLAAVLLALVAAFFWSLPVAMTPVFLLLWAGTFASSRRYRKDRPKKPLAYTYRMRRILVLSGILSLALVVSGAILGLRFSGWWSAWFFASGFFVADLLAPFFVAVAVVALKPVEYAIQEGFKRSARARLAERSDLEIIAITGSYGKTSVKHAVAEILGHRFSVLATPGSFNTPMGICRVINNQLSSAHRMLILEMGVRHPGDIAELCEIARPNIAIITSVGIAHLESMGSIDAIAKEKGSLLDFVQSRTKASRMAADRSDPRAGGHAVLNADDERVLRMGWDFPGTVWPVSCEGHSEAIIKASEISYGPDGAVFTVTDETGESVRMSTRLVGRHNVTNVLMAVAVGRIYGLRLRQIRQAVTRLEPVPHRLEVRRENGVTVIDDAFNSNPIGARNAIEMLGQIGTGRRFIVTPGMIELGESEEGENRLLGTLIAEHADVAVLVGAERTTSIADGIRSSHFPEENILVVRTLFEARDYLKSVLQDGDVVLYENDLPDQFNEG